MEKYHELKLWPEYYNAIARGDKQFEIRKNDRDYQVGDMVLLREFNPDESVYSGRKIWGHITFITPFMQKSGYVVFNFHYYPDWLQLQLSAEREEELKAK